jgi:hypothetical protein
MLGMKYRKLRITWSVGWGILCLLLIMLWVRSYTTCDVFGRELYKGDVLAISFQGQVHMLEPRKRESWEYHFEPLRWMSFPSETTLMNWGQFTCDEGSFRIYPGSSRLYLVATHWLLAALIAPLAIVPWVSWSRSFSVRTLLIVATLLALILGSLLAMMNPEL